jgi:hypothetical protein
MVDLRTRPEKCERCRTGRAALIHHVRDVDVWVCWECSHAIVQRQLEEEDSVRRGNDAG